MIRANVRPFVLVGNFSSDVGSQALAESCLQYLRDSAATDIRLVLNRHLASWVYVWDAEWGQLTAGPGLFSALCRQADADEEGEEFSLDMVSTSQKTVSLDVST